jgi:predicted RecA/RadA family phage recombinase
VVTVLNTNKSATVPSGTAFILGTRAGVAIADIADDAEGAVALEGVFEFTCGTANAIAMGDPIYAEVEGTDAVTGTADSLKLLGKAVHASAGTTGLKILVRLEGSA